MSKMGWFEVGVTQSPPIVTYPTSIWRLVGVTRWSFLRFLASEN